MTTAPSPLDLGPWIFSGSWSFAAGLVRSWPHDGTYQVFLQSDLLLEVRSVLKRYERWNP